MLELIRQIRWQDLVDIGIITFLVYRSLQIVRGSRAMQMIMGLAVILVAYVSSRPMLPAPAARIMLAHRW